MFFEILIKRTILCLLFFSLKDVFTALTSLFFISFSKNIVLEIIASGFYLPFAIIIRKHIYWLAIIISLVYFSVRDNIVFHKNHLKKIKEQRLHLSQKNFIQKDISHILTVYDFSNKFTISNAAVYYVNFIFLQTPFVEMKDHMTETTIFITLVCLIINNIYKCQSLLLKTLFGILFYRTH